MSLGAINEEGRFFKMLKYIELNEGNWCRDYITNKEGKHCANGLIAEEEGWLPDKKPRTTGVFMYESMYRLTGREDLYGKLGLANDSSATPEEARDCLNEILEQFNAPWRFK